MSNDAGLQAPHERARREYGPRYTVDDGVHNVDIDPEAAPRRDMEKSEDHRIGNLSLIHI